jgi:hypothetical protein
MKALDTITTPQDVAEASGEILAALHDAGAVLLRGFDLTKPDALGEVVRAFGGSPLSYQDAATPRTEVGGQVYTSTDYPPSEEIELHNEGCYSEMWPAYLYFGCVTPADGGGATTIADGRRLLEELPPDLVAPLRQKGVAYVRTYHPRLGLSWEHVFGTDDPAEVTRLGALRGIETEWLDGGVLRTRQRRPATVRHLRTGEECWFNQVVAFHPAALPADIRAALARAVPAGMAPKQVTYGDGTPIEDEVVAEIRRVARKLSEPIEWREGDVAMVDNVLAAHGRLPYRGRRKVLVSMSHAMAWTGADEAVPA